MKLAISDDFNINPATLRKIMQMLKRNQLILNNNNTLLLIYSTTSNIFVLSIFKFINCKSFLNFMKLIHSIQMQFLNSRVANQLNINEL